MVSDMSNPMDRGAVWSEGRGITEDVMHGLDDASANDADVVSVPVKRGIILTANCARCGRQGKHVISWGEIALWEMKRTGGRKWNTDVEQPTRQGLMVALSCNGGACHKPFSCVMDWDELRRWIDVGVQSGCLDPKILTLSKNFQRK